MERPLARDSEEHFEREVRERFKHVDLEHPVLKWLFEECLRRRREDRDVG